MNKPIFFFAFANNLFEERNYLRNLPDEMRAIRSALKQAERAGLCTIVERSNVTIDEIFSVFQDGQYANNITLFHFAGHADSYHLLLESADQKKSLAHAEGLMAFLGRQQGLQLVFLNGCSTEKQATALIEAGIHAVIGTATRINDETAKTLAARFYRGLGNGASFSKAWQDAVDEQKTKGGGFYRGGLNLSEALPDRFPWELHIREGAEQVKTWNLSEAAGDPLFGLPPVPSDYFLPEMPFLYLHRFEKKHAKIFFGRGAAIRNLHEQLTSPYSNPILLLHGQSGVGKSSLLEAGLFPRLEKNHGIRFQRRDAEKGLVTGLMELLGADNGQPLKQAWLEIEAKDGQPLVVVLDQVEEIFTQPNEQTPDELNALSLVLKDIFYHKKDSPQGKLILSYRKEFHAEINEVLKKHELPRSSVFVERLDRAGIVEAVKGLTSNPDLRQQYKLTIEDNLPEIIADDLLEDKASAIAPILQILLTKMWEKSMEESGTPRFAVHDYQHEKKAGNLLSHFLEEKLHELESWNKEAVNSGLVLDLLVFHTTDMGTAKQQEIKDVVNRYKNKQELVNAMIQKVKDVYLITDFRKDKKTPALTLAHDALALLVKDKYEKSDLPGPKAFRILRNKINEWKKERSSALLTEEEVKALLAGRAGMRDWDTEETQLVEQCQRYIQKLKWQKKVMNFVVGGLGLAAMLLGFFFYLNNSENRLIKKADRLFGEGQALVTANPTAAKEKMLEGWQTKKSQTKLGIILNLYRENLFFDTLFYKKNAAINLVAFSPSTELFALTKKNLNNIYLYKWEGQKATLLDSLSGADNDISSLVFSNDGRFIVGGATDRKTHIWNWQQQSHQVLSESAGHINEVCISPNGQLVAAASDDTLLVFDVRSGEGKKKPIDEYIEVLEFGSDNASIWIGGKDRYLYFLNLEKESLHALHSDGSPIQTVLKVGTENTVMHLSEKGAYVWNTSEAVPQLEKTFNGLLNRFRYTDAACSPDGKLLLTASEDKIARLWNMQTETLLYEMNGHQHPIRNLAFSPSGSGVLTASAYAIFHWGLRMGSPAYSLQQEGFSIEALGVSPDGQNLMAGTRKPTVEIYDLPKKGFVFSPEINTPDRIGALAVDPQGKWFFTGDNAGQLQQWPITQGAGKMLHQFENAIIEIDAKGPNILIATDQNDAFLWKSNPTGPVALKGHHDIVLSIALSADATLGISGGLDSLVILWDMQSGQMKDSFFHHYGEIRALAFYDEDRSFMSIDENSNLYSWNLKSREHRFRKLKEENVKFLLIDPQDQYYVTASSFKIGIWYLQDQHILLRQLETPDNDRVRSLAISPDGKWLYSGHRSGKVHAWKNDWLPGFLDK